MDIPEGAHGELAFQIGLQTNISTVLCMIFYVNIFPLISA